ncbi:MAG TPA: ATP-binding protein [Polyangiaceae bacterium]|nr:ATP-binding protein [Polyangiaceae bacterium]
MAPLGRIRWRLTLATAAIAILPLLVSIIVARSMVRQATERFFIPEIGLRLDQSLGVYQELAKSIKLSMRHAADAIAATQSVRDAAGRRDRKGAQSLLVSQIARYPGLVSLELLDARGETIAAADRGSPVDDATEKKLEIERALCDSDDECPRIRAVFVTERARLDELESMGQFLETYRKIEKRRLQDEKTYIQAFSVLLVLTVLIAATVGFWLARGPTVRLTALAGALHRVATGDLSVRVAEGGQDEIGDLARALNRMVAEVETSRARIEYLQRIGAWQEMARRLAHEIKNPLTPIQLAVQEVHRRCPEDHPQFRHLVDETLHIVEDEVETLRHLVSEFSNFARMPQAQLQLNDLGEFLRQHRGRLALEEDESTSEDAGESIEPSLAAAEVTVETPPEPSYAFFDSHMLKRALINLVHNAVQAIAGTGRESGRVTIRLSDGGGEFWSLDVEDNGPGIPEELQPVVFDPYVTTKRTGTGLGLAIVKKVIMEHGGAIVVSRSKLGGARMQIRIPKAGSSAARIVTASGPNPPGATIREQRANVSPA